MDKNRADVSLLDSVYPHTGADPKNIYGSFSH